MSAETRIRRWPERAVSAEDGRTTGRYIPGRAAGFDHKNPPAAHPGGMALLEFRIEEAGAAARAGKNVSREAPPDASGTAGWKPPHSCGQS
jgi:hypothetical protein